ncbi:MAG: GntR family transcriptional regulator [Anaerolineales bacterium]|nr:GntR family transcriptional regulator [Anaerolineales bacterium]
MPERGRSAGRIASRKAVGGRPLYQHTAEALASLLARTAPGTYLPSEPELARRLGVSRATLREAMRSFGERGLVVRRQGVGTYVTEAPQVIDTGLEVLESIETLAARMGLSTSMGALQVRRRAADADEARSLELGAAGEVVEVSRVMLAEGRPVAYLVDVLVPGILPDGALERGFTGSVLDLLLRQGEPALDSARTEITAVSATGEIARSLSIQRGDVLLGMEAYLFTKDNHAVDHSLSYFLPGTFRFSVLRRVGRHP